MLARKEESPAASVLSTMGKTSQRLKSTNFRLRSDYFHDFPTGTVLHVFE